MFRRTILVECLLVLAVILIGTPSSSMAQRVRAVAAQRNVEIRLADDAVIRFTKAPKQFDEKGNPVAPTPEQLKALKGDRKLPGYAAELSDLKEGQIVKVTLAKQRIPKDLTTSGAGDEKKPQKSSWTSLGEFTGRVTKVHGVGGNGKGKGKKDTEPTLIISFDTLVLAHKGHNSGGHPKETLGQDVFATRVMILPKPPAE
jgi:hypothetical protein